MRLSFVYNPVETVLAVGLRLVAASCFLVRRVNPFLFLLILDISEDEDEILLLARLQLHVDAVAGYWAPSVGMAVARESLSDGIGHRFLRV